MPRPGQHLECHRYTSRCTQKVQSPTEKAPTLCGTSPKVGTGPGKGAIDLAASSSPNVLAHRHRHRYAVYDERFSCSECLPQHFQHVLQPTSCSQSVHS